MYSEEELLSEIQRLASNGIAPGMKEMRSGGRFDETNIMRRCGSGSWWKASVRAGLRPQMRRPLTPVQYHRFREMSLARSDPQESIIGLLKVYTGLGRHHVSQMTQSWWEHLDESPHQPTVTVPGTVTASGEPWVFKIPARFHVDDEKYVTELPGLMRWYFSLDDQSFPSESRITEIIAQITADMQVTDRQQTSFSGGKVQLENKPEIRSGDLRATVGVHLARRGAPARLIRRHLGVEHTDQRGDLDDYFLWCHVHDDDFSHPDYDPPDVVLDPVSP